MTRVEIHHPAPDAGSELANALFEPRDDWVVSEIALEPGPTSGQRFDLLEGPFDRWQRTLRFDATTGSAVETIDFHIAAGILARPFGLLYGWALKRKAYATTAPFWAPPQRYDARATRVYMLLIVATITAAYLGTLLSQTITFVADDFDASRRTQGLVTAMTRLGALIALAVVWAADRVGRRSMLLWAGTGATVFAAVAALSPNIWFFGFAQLGSRGFATGFGLLIGVIAAEESPAGSRAWTTAILALFAGLGSGMVLWMVPIADAGIGYWRWLFVIALLALPVLWALRRRLPESRRYESLESRGDDAAPITDEMKRRFAKLAIVGFALSMFAAPSSNFQNEYLRDERGFSGTRISLFSSATNTPIGIGVAIFGPIADRRGRRLIGAIGVVGGVVFTVLRYGVDGPLMWVGGTLSTVIGAATIPALGVYGPELFPTSRRGLANGLLTCVAVVGSALGLFFVGEMSQRWSFGQTFAVLAIVPLLATIVIGFYPKTANRALEDINPEDAAGSMPPIL